MMEESVNPYHKPNNHNAAWGITVLVLIGIIFVMSSSHSTSMEEKQSELDDAQDCIDKYEQILSEVNDNADLGVGSDGYEDKDYLLQEIADQSDGTPIECI